MIYFDNAATTLRKPETVAKAVFEAINTLGNPGRGAYDASLEASRVMLDTRQLLARLFGVEEHPERVAFSMNSTESLNTAIRGTLEKGDTVITTVLEHNSVLRPLYRTVGEDNMIVLGCDENGMVWPEDFKAALEKTDKKVKAIVCTHASNVTGNVLDIKEIGQLARDHGALFIVDASQTAGCLPVDANDADIICFTGHKSLLGPQGTGGMYVRDGMDIVPLKTGGSGVQSYLKTAPAEMPAHLEAGTQNAHSIAGLREGVKFILSEGIDNVHKKDDMLAGAFYDEIKDIPGVKFYGDFSLGERAPIVSISIRGIDSGILAFTLSEEYGICARTGAHCAPLMHEALGTQKSGLVRFSFSYFNTIEEVRETSAALHEIAQSV